MSGTRASLNGFASKPDVVADCAGALRRAASYATLAAVVTAVGGAGAWAECRRPGLAATVDLIPLATGTAVSSVISTISTINTSSLAQSTAFAGSPQNPQPDQQGGGNWSRVIAGSTEAQNNTVTVGSVPGIGSLGANDCHSTTKHDFVGTQAGMDIGRFNFAGGGNLYYGVTAGYFDITSRDKTPNVGTFKGESQVPFAGLYLGVNSGNFAFDAQVRGDYFDLQLSDVDQGMFNQHVSARGLAFLWNASYRFNLPNQWFIEPSIGGVSSRTEVDRFDAAGGINVPSSLSPTSFSLPGSVKIEDINSLLGRASIRAGTTIISGQMAWQPFATASVFHEFAGNVRANMTTLDLGFPLDGRSSTSREGTVGHVGLGLAGVLLNTGWLGYVRGDYRFGDNVESVSVNAGLRYQFQPEAKQAGLKDSGEHDDYKHFDWTGFYAGWNSGSLWGIQEFRYNVGGTSDPKHQGYTLGGQAGFNYQIGRAVVGIEADYSWSNAEGGSRTGFNPYFSVEGGIDSIGFATGRLGYAHQRALYYVKGGLAYAEVEAGAKDNLDGTGRVLALPVLRKTDWQTGWAFGAGMEYAVSDRWSVKGEWLHYDLGSSDFPLQGAVGAKVETSGDVARIGVNYHFGHREEHHESMK